MPLFSTRALIIAGRTNRFGSIGTRLGLNSAAKLETVEIAIPELKDLIKRYLQHELRLRDSYSDNIADVDVCTDVIMYAELRGNNQGLVKLVSHALQGNPDASSISLEHETPLSARVNGSQRIGMCVVAKGIEIAKEKAKQSKVAVVACSNYSSATGAIGYWARKLADDGLIGIVMSQCNELMAPHGSYEPIFGTNPLAVGVPISGGSGRVVLDMATSAEAYFGILTSAMAGRPIRGDVAYDAEGNETTDPVLALKGALRVFDRGHKGSGLALIIELLAGAFTGASVENKAISKNWGTLIIAIDPNIFGAETGEEFKKNAAVLCERVKHAKRLKDVKAIYLPGERGDEVEQQNLEKGTINVQKKVYEELTEAIRR